MLLASVYQTPKLISVCMVHVALLTSTLMIGTNTANAQAEFRQTQQTSTEVQELDSQESSLAAAWSMDASEWHRYQELMDGLRGSISPSTLSPVEVLGIHARDSAERRIYAERWAVLMHDDAERILAFQRAYDDAVKRLYPTQRLIDRTLGGTRAFPVTQLDANDRVEIGIHLNCTSCDAVVERVVSRHERFAGIDIKVHGEATLAEVKAWIARRQIAAPLIRKGLVNVTIVEGESESSLDTLPTLRVARGGKSFPLAYAAL